MPVIPSSLRKSSHRFTFRDGRANVVRQGLRRLHMKDWYHWLMTLDRLPLIGVAMTVYLVLNFFFATLYFMDPSGIKGAPNGSFADCFFFSVQTLSTVGYGIMSPKSFYVNFVVTAECLVGMLSVGLITGLLFNRFSRPTSRVMFTHNVIIDSYEGLPTLMFRAANRRGNQILRAEMRVTLARTEKTLEGESLRRVHDLKLVRNQASSFSLPWTVRHQIDANSPLYGETVESMRASGSEITVLLTGIDDVFGQTIYSRFAYNNEEILFNHRFVTMFERDEHNRPIIDYRKFDLVEPVPSASP